MIIFGAGVQGTVYGVRLARAGHDVTLIARHRRAEELRSSGAKIRSSGTFQTIDAPVTVREELTSDCKADFCLVTVRREQLSDALISVARATQIDRFIFLVNHANGSEDIFAAVGRSRAVLAFPGVAGAYQGDVISYVDIARQPTVVEEAASDVAELFKCAGFNVDRVHDVDAWLKRHAVFITSIAGALYEKGCSARRLATDHEAVRRLILAVREGWLELDRLNVKPAAWPLRFILCQAPPWLSVRYWSKLLGSERGEMYFAAHVRRSPAEMLALAKDVRNVIPTAESPELTRLLNAIQLWQER